MLTEAMGFSEFSLNNRSVSKSPDILYFVVILSVSGLPTCSRKNRLLCGQRKNGFFLEKTI